uniref:AAA domain-containing protein n=1 Tax=uncultured microorganism TaxID=358574 RepID=F8UHW8_9ZZZZ|nr:hypothetical protein LDC_03491 [uncultured microorganism]
MATTGIFLSLAIIFIDHIKDIKIIVTGSSSFDLANDIGEPLTGRKYTLRLFPLAQYEIITKDNYFDFVA